MNNRIDRRTFLEILTTISALPATGIAAGNGSADPISDGALTNLGSGRRVVVLGAGLAGLSAAYNLMKNGYEVIVLEAQDRPGGRVRTVREGFQNSGHAEMGALRIFETHEYTLKYVNAFGLELAPYTDTGSRAFFMHGKRFLPPKAGEPWPLEGFNSAEQPDPFARFPEYLESGFAKLGNLSDPAWPVPYPSALELDQSTFSEYMASQGASETWRKWFFAQEGNIARINALAGFTVEFVANGTLVRSIRGGNDALPKAFAAALGDRIKYMSPVVRITQRDPHVVVNYLDRTGLHEITGHRCVCALPFAPLRRVIIATPFSDAKMAAIQRLQYMAAARCYFQTVSQFWKYDPLGELGGLNMIGTDTMAGRVWNTSALQPDPTKGMLHSYMFDTEALEFTSHGAARVIAMRKLFGKLLPGIEGQIIGVNHKAWHEDPWQGGGWGWTQPSEMKWMFPAMRQVDGRVHFAGEHTSLWIAWMNGALESAERVSKEILEADARLR